MCDQKSIKELYMHLRIYSSYAVCYFISGHTKTKPIKLISEKNRAVLALTRDPDFIAMMFKLYGPLWLGKPRPLSSGTRHLLWV